MRIIRHALILMAVLMPSLSYSQSLWTSAEIKYQFLQKFSAKFEGEYRTLNKFSGTERCSAGIGIDYKIIKYLKADAGYKFIYRHIGERVTTKGNIVEAFWQPRQRAYLSFTGQYKWNRFTFSLRERYQFTHHKSMHVGKTNGNGKPKEDEFIEGKDRNVLRSRIKIDYSFKKSGFSPYISAEIYNNLNGFCYDKTRFTAGTEFKINRHNTVEAFYRYIDKSDHDEEGGNIIGIGYQFKF